ncbi:LpqB family beta-propeller domain-containing protein [Microbacterium sp. gxy059]|uniref:LpqB family beta-propeller domain-containing protein n=1 Tax=Microbacterium sp. gxy059 TaxID=2957199 RepID=UPI003D953CB7
MIRPIRRLAAALAAFVAAATALAACAGLPVDGYPQQGSPVGEAEAAPRWQFSPDGPADDARAEDIVLGFLDAVESPADNWAIAREFLSDDFAERWDPEAGVTVDSINDRAVGDFTSFGEDEGSGAVDVTIAPTSTVSDTGEYRTAPSGSVVLSFELARDDDGQWRITEAPPGVVVHSGNFPLIYEARTLMFFDPTWRFLVPEVRWFPSTSQPIETIVRGLIGGSPSSWLEGAAVSAFDEDVRLRAVETLDDRVARVDLTENARDAPDEQQERMRTQLWASLQASDAADELRLEAGGTALGAADAQASPTLPDARAVVMTEEEFGFFAAGAVEPIAGISEVFAERFAPAADADDPATSIEIAGDGGEAVVQTEDGTVWRVRDDATFDPITYEGDTIAPALDPFGCVWTADGTDPGTLRAWAPDGSSLPIDGLARLRSVTDIAVSRDGARLAVAGRTGSRDVLFVASIPRDEEGIPLGLGPLQPVAQLDGAARSIAWVSDTSVAAAVVTDGSTSIIEQTIGGLSERITVSLDVDTVTYGNPSSAERLLTSDGELYVRRSTTASWQKAGDGVVLLATQLGAPPAGG